MSGKPTLRQTENPNSFRVTDHTPKTNVAGSTRAHERCPYESLHLARVSAGQGKAAKYQGEMIAPCAKAAPFVQARTPVCHGWPDSGSGSSMCASQCPGSNEGVRAARGTVNARWRRGLQAKRSRSYSVPGAGEARTSLPRCYHPVR